MFLCFDTSDLNDPSVELEDLLKSSETTNMYRTVVLKNHEWAPQMVN